MRFHLVLVVSACMAGAAQAMLLWPGYFSSQPQIQYKPEQSDLSWAEVLTKLENSPVLKGRLKNWPPKHRSYASPWRGKSAHRLVDQRWPNPQNPHDRHQKWHTGANSPPNSQLGEGWMYSKDTGFMERMPEWYHPKAHDLDEPLDWHHSDDGRPPVPNGIGLDDYSSGHTPSDWHHSDDGRPPVPNGIGLDVYSYGDTPSDWRYHHEVKPKVPNGIRLPDYFSEQTPGALHDRDEVRPKVPTGITLPYYFSEQTPGALHDRDEVRPKVPNGIRLDDYFSEHTPSALHYTHKERSKVPNSIGSGDSLPARKTKFWHRPDEAWRTLQNDTFGPPVGFVS